MIDLFGIGNALVDFESKITETFLDDHLLEKGQMYLKDEAEIVSMRDKLPSDLKMSSGGYKLLSGHLMRLDKDKAGKTTVRFFAMENPTAEIPELLLSVYKSAAKSKRLNALSVRRISDVALLPGDAEEHKQFSIQVGEALYYLEARNPEDARLWVDSLRAVMGRDIGLEEDGGACALM